MAGAQHSNADQQRLTAARDKIATCDTKLDRYRTALAKACQVASWAARSLPACRSTSAKIKRAGTERGASCSAARTASRAESMRSSAGDALARTRCRSGRCGSSRMPSRATVMACSVR